jgi:hypothetical protein
MSIVKGLSTAILATLLWAAVSTAAQAPVTVVLQPDGKNPESPAMGDRLQFWSTITNKGPAPLEGMVAWISLVEIDPGHEQPVDLEDWSAHKALTGASLEPGQHLLTNWPMRLIKEGDYRVVISITDRNDRQVYTSPAVQFHVRPKPVLKAGRVLPVAAVIPLGIIGLMVFSRTKLHRRERKE